jgi:multidrug efflux pump subunit AcrB
LNALADDDVPQKIRTSVFALALIVVFLVLAALYESWATPFSVLLAIPLSVFGAMAGLTAIGHTNNLYAEIGLILFGGLMAKTPS